MDAMNAVVSAINNVLWSYVLIVVLVGCGIYFTLSTHLVQLRMLPEMLRLLTEGIGKKTEGDAISSFQAFCVSTASRVGVGNIAGIAIAVVLGGPGAIFWMWFIAAIGAATGFIESTLAQIYKHPKIGGGFHGGPAYYIRFGLNSKVLAILFAILISVTYGLIYNSVQANTIAASLKTFNVDPVITGIVIAILTALVIFGGVTRIAKVSEWIVPIMAGLYILTALYIVLVNITTLPAVFAAIFTKAFSFDAASGGLFGAAVMNGIKRGLFSNEAGEGSVPNAAASADVSHPAKQGLIQSFGVFVDTFLICTSSAFIVLVSGNYESSGLTGIALVQHDLAIQLGDWAPSVIAIFVFMFAFSSIVANYIYAENNLFFLRLNNPKAIWCLRICTFATVIGGTLLSLPLMWQLADIIMACMAITNLTAILLLSPVVHTIASDYLRQRKLGVRPVFDPLRYPDIGRQLSPDAWDDVSQE